MVWDKSWEWEWEWSVLRGLEEACPTPAAAMCTAAMSDVVFTALMGFVVKN